MKIEKKINFNIFLTNEYAIKVISNNKIPTYIGFDKSLLIIYSIN